jgi:hypothetical protein
VLDTPNNVGHHSLTVTATIGYYEYDYTDGSRIDKSPISTSVNLKIGPDNNNDRDHAQLIGSGTYERLFIGGYDEDDYYKIPASTGYTISVSAWALQPSPTSHDPDFYLYLRGPGGGIKRSAGPGKDLSFSYTVGSSCGFWFIQVHIADDYGFYTLSVGVSMPGGGCPTLFVWNGTNYAKDSILNISWGHHSDATLATKIQQPLVSDGYFYRLELRELDEFTSHIDYVKLYAMDYTGEAYRIPLVDAIHSESGRVRRQLRRDDERRVDLEPNQTIGLSFLALNTAYSYFVFEINGYNPKWKPN